MTISERMTVYDKVFSFIINNRINTAPAPLGRIASLLNAEIVTVREIIAGTGLAAAQIFEIWGNNDGCVSDYVNSAGNHRFKIAINDIDVVPGRVRFTVAEELAHIILGHIFDPDFNMFSQEYKETKYYLYDEQARMASGLLLCSPNLFYEHELYLHERGVLMELCGLTGPCAEARCAILNRYKQEIQAHPLYDKLPEIYCDLTNLPKHTQYIKRVYDSASGRPLGIAFQSDL